MGASRTTEGVRRMAKRKRTKRTAEKEIEGLKVGPITSTSEIPIVRGGRKATEYSRVIDQMARLRREGDAFEIHPPKGTDLPTFSNRITSLLQRHPVNPPEGLRFAKHNTSRGSVAITLTSKKGRK